MLAYEDKLKYSRVGPSSAWRYLWNSAWSHSWLFMNSCS
eukprot:CAMPEP_0198536330 /NCGR_PEP_ID=MMETSP1462-20131121/41411_1 /TAXON_ID=1333877 /ORGANISM="Brandtodinium nutriculum, Strain RCC3387" /LENGTH=38 /DNA_ID= /DNA_START= /DNA_END= /DNA_ORIENTATION=